MVIHDSEMAEYETSFSRLNSSAPMSLRTPSGPVMGGMMLEYYNHVDATYHTCTVGFVTTYNGAPAAVTNSHCSTQEWKREGTEYYFGTYMGTEVRDPGSDDNCGYLWLQKCRYADALIFSVTGHPARRGYIARPRSMHSDSDDAELWSEIDPSRPTLQIAGRGNSTVGAFVDKIGARTGWTYSTVKKKCVDTSTSVGHRFYCQHWSKYGRGGGDRGGPVFNFRVDFVDLLGIHWGHIWYAFEYFSVYSPDDEIMKDLGSLTVTP